MAALPYMPLFVADYLADTAHFTTLQHGAYLLLIMNYWQRGKPLPDDDAKLARIAGMSVRNWQQIKAPIVELFETGNDSGTQQLHHRRIDRELDRVQVKSLKSKKAAQASVQRRFGERSTDAERVLNHTQAHTDTSIPLDKSNGAGVDPDKAFWNHAKAYLGKGKASLIGQWVRDHGKEATAAAIAAAQVDRAVDPVEFIQGRFRKHAKAQNYDRDRITV